MPIYAYRCNACGHAKDVLQKISDPVLTTCPACGAEAFQKQITAAGFQLKGSGWYATDFRNNGGGSSTASTGSSAPAPSPAPSSSSSEGSSGSASSGSSGSSGPSASACGGGCACH